jgi:hypothetical protein
MLLSLDLRSGHLEEKCRSTLTGAYTPAKLPGSTFSPKSGAAQLISRSIAKEPYLMRLRKISIKGLFEVFNHEVPVNVTDRVTIIHGPNGFGKTVMLKMVAALLEGTTTIFERIPFTEFALTLDDGISWVLRRNLDKTTDRVRLELFRRTETGEAQLAVVPNLRDVPTALYASIDKFVPPPYTLENDEWVDEDGEVFDLPTILDMFQGVEVPQNDASRSIRTT